ncbi:MAG: glycosyltransferase family 4 protein [Pseudomonadota bacterium]
MKLLYLHPKAWSGEYAILKKFRELGHDICVLEEAREEWASARRVSADFLEPGDGIPTLWYSPHRGWEKILTWPADQIFKRAFDGRNLVHRMWVIREAIRHFRPDAIVCTDGFTYAIPAAFLKRLGMLRVPLLASYIGGDILDCPEALVGKRRTPMVSWLIRNSIPGIDTLRPLCRSLADILVKEGADPKRIHIVPIQLPAPLAQLEQIRLNRAAIGAEVRRRYGIARGCPLVVTLSGNHKGKGLHHLAQAWRAIFQAVPGACWLLCGPHEPWLTEAVWPELRRQGLEHTVHFAGALSGIAVYEHLAAGDIHVNPTLCEGLNIVTVEAAAVGTPTITSDGAGIADWVERLQAGSVVPAGDVAALAQAVIVALQTPELRLTWQERTRSMAPDFSLDRIAAQLLALLPASH